MSEVRLAAGQSYQRPAGIEHDVMNGSDQPMAFVEIEIKRPEGADDYSHRMCSGPQAFHGLGQSLRRATR